MWEARKRGVVFDAGSFWFRIVARKQQLLPDTISTDMDPDSILLPRAEMMTTLSKFLNLGLTVDQLIERSTINPARAIRRSDLGTLSEGAVADVALIEIQNGKFGFLDAGHAKLPGDRRMNCVLTVRDGAIVWDSEGLAATDWIKAGPYRLIVVMTRRNILKSVLNVAPAALLADTPAADRHRAARTLRQDHESRSPPARKAAQRAV